MKKEALAFLLACPVLLPLGGCYGRGDPAASTDLDMVALASAPVSPAAHASARADLRPRAISAGDAIVTLPDGAGRPKVARDRRHPNGYSQQIQLASDAPGATSTVEVAIQNGRPISSTDKAPVWKPGEAGIREELARQFPTMRMQVVADRPYENQYGRFGLAIGRSGDDLRCIYAWQYIDDARRTFAGGEAIPLEGGVTGAPAALRVKLCRSDATVDELVAYAKRLNVAIPQNYAAAEPIVERLPPAPRAVAHAEPKKPPRAVAQEAPVRAARAAPVRVIPTPTPTSEPVASPQAAYGAAPNGLRYMAPTASDASAATAPTNGGFRANLPPEAYRGPASASGGKSAAPPLPNPYQRDSSLPAEQSRAARPQPASQPPGAPQVQPLRTVLDLPAQ